jgi:hypothetical protein
MARGDEAVTPDKVVSYFLEREGVDVLRKSLLWICQQLMESEVSEDGQVLQTATVEYSGGVAGGEADPIAWRRGGGGCESTSRCCGGHPSSDQYRHLRPDAWCRALRSGRGSDPVRHHVARSTIAQPT